MARKGTFMREVDHGYNALKAELMSIKATKPYVKIGMVGPAAARERDGGLNNAELALVMEFGSPAKNIPARPWISAAFKKNQAVYVDLLAKGLKQVYEGKMDAPTLLGLVGAKAAADVKNYVTQGAQVPPPNSPATMQRKIEKGYGQQARRDRHNGNASATEGPLASPRTLVDTGKMVGAVTWQVVASEKSTPMTSQRGSLSARFGEQE